MLVYFMATHPVFEPGTSSLTVKRSTAELMRIIFMEESIVIETNRINYNLFSKQLHKPLCFTFHWMRHKDSNLRHAQSKCAVLPT